MTLTFGLMHRGEYPQPVESELEQIIASLQVLASRLNVSDSTVLATGASHTVDDVITVLQNLGLVKQS